MSDDPLLESYVRKIMDLQYERPKEPLKEAELKQIAMEMGLTEADWAESQKQGTMHESRGAKYASSGNWEDAVTEYESAVAINPSKVDTVFGLAEAYLYAGDEGKSDQYLDQVLRMAPMHKGAIKLKNHKAKLETTNMESERTGKMMKYGAMALVAFLAISWMVSTYNGLVTKEEQTVEAWAQVENQYQRRADLIPNLIATVKGAANFEQETLDQVINARSAATSIKVDPSNMTQEALDAFTAKQGQLQSALGRLMAIAEDYPVLSSLENFRDLQAQLEGTENRISVERRRFNDVVGDFNSTAKRFPNSIMGFDSKAYFRSGDGASELPEVDL